MFSKIYKVGCCSIFWPSVLMEPSQPDREEMWFDLSISDVFVRNGQILIVKYIWNLSIGFLNSIQISLLILWSLYVIPRSTFPECGFYSSYPRIWISPVLECSVTIIRLTGYVRSDRYHEEYKSPPMSVIPHENIL